MLLRAGTEEAAAGSGEGVSSVDVVTGSGGIVGAVSTGCGGGGSMSMGISMGIGVPEAERPNSGCGSEMTGLESDTADLFCPLLIELNQLDLWEAVEGSGPSGSWLGTALGTETTSVGGGREFTAGRIASVASRRAFLFTSATECKEAASNVD